MPFILERVPFQHLNTSEHAPSSYWARPAERTTVQIIHSSLVPEIKILKKALLWRS